jgi:hypothetical protein
MPETTALDNVLRLVAEGRLSAEEAGPILDALEGSAAPAQPGDPETVAGRDDDSPARAIRVEVTEGGRSVINLRIPLSLGRAAISQVPGISEATSDRIREAIEGGVKGSIVEVDEGGDGVRISIE